MPGSSKPIWRGVSLRAYLSEVASHLAGCYAHSRRSMGRDEGQRRAIIRVLLGNEGEHPTAEQIFTRVRSMIPDMSPAMVYNTLHELVEMGALLELDLGLGQRRYDINAPDHAHLVCLECGRVEDIPCRDEALTLPPEHAHGFRVVDCRVVFRGYCPACAFPEEGQEGTS